MGLRVVTGRANAGKSGRIYEELRQAARDGLSPVLLLPSEPDVGRARAEFAAEGLHGLRVIVFDRWVSELWGLHGDGRRLVTAGRRELLLTRAAEQRSSEFGGRSPGHGLLGVLGRLAQRVARPESIPSRPGPDSSIREILCGYARDLEAEGLIELARATELMADSQRELNEPIFINRFADLSATQELLVASLSRRTDVWIALPWEAGHVPTTALTGLVERLSRAGAHEHVPSPCPTDELSHLEALVSGETTGIQPGGMVSMAEASDETGEAVLAIYMIRELLAQGVPASRVVLTSRRTERRAATVLAAARQAGVPLYVDLRSALPNTRLGSALLALLDVVSGREATRERFSTFVRSPFSGISAIRAAELDREWRTERVTGSGLVDTLGRTGGDVAVTLRAARMVCAERARSENWKELVDSFVRNARCLEGIDSTESRRDASAHRAVLEIVESATSGGGELPREADLRTLLKATSVAQSWGDESAAVHFTEAHRVRSMRYDAVVLCGLNADEFSPERAPSWETSFLERAGLDSEEEARLRERLLFYSLVTRARQRLVLLRAQVDSGGRPSRPSALWEEVADAYRTPDEAAEGTLPPGLFLSGHDPSVSLTGPLTCGNIPGSKPVNRARRGKPASARELHGAALDLLRDTGEFSVTELEAYIRCPYSWFFERMIRPREIDSTLGPREAGSAAHAILARFYDRWTEESGATRMQCELLDQAKDILNEICSEVLAGYGKPQGLEEEYGMRRIHAWTEAVIEDDASILPGFRPGATELRFGSAVDRPFEFGGIRLAGSIDRIDVGAEWLVVTDYKTSSSVKGHAAFPAAGLVQLPVYTAAATRMLDLPAAGAVYRSLASRRARGFWREDVVDLQSLGSRVDRLDQEGLAAVVADAEVRVTEAVAGIRAGDVEARPLAGACTYCGFGSLCPSRSDR